MFVVCGVPDKNAIIKNVPVHNRLKFSFEKLRLKNYLNDHKLVKSNE